MLTSEFRVTLKTPSGVYRQTHNLRWIMRDGEKVLQQMYMEIHKGNTYWDDVPLVDPEKDAVQS